MTRRRGAAWSTALLLLPVALGLAAACATAPQRDPEQVLEDATMTSRIKAGLLRDPVVAGSAIGVEVLDGVVTLTGRVPNDAVAARAVEIAGGVKGVRQVEDRLVRGGSTSSRAAPQSGASGAAGPGRGTLP